MVLQENTKKQLISLNKSVAENANKVVNLLYSNPFQTVDNIKDVIKVSKQTANSLVKTLQKYNILYEITGKKRYRHFVFKEYLLTG